MPQMEQRLKSPDLRKLEIYINLLKEAEGEDPIEALFVEDDVVELREMLEWIFTYLCNRKDYHKKRQLEKSAQWRLLEEALRQKYSPEELAAIKRRARNLAADELVDASQEAPVLPRSERRDREEL